MLQSIRDNSQGIIAKVIVGLIAVTFALFGVESLVSLTAGSNAPATVNGTEISQQELYRGVQLQRRQMLSQMGENADPTLLDDKLIEEMVLNGLIDQTILVQSAQQQGLAFSDHMIDQMIVSTQAFQIDGKFDRNQFESVLRNAGLTPLLYRQILRREKLTEQEQIAYLVSAFSLPGEVRQVLALDRQTRDLRYFTLDAQPARQAVALTDEELQNYFDQHRADFMTEEQVEIEYVLLDQAQLAGDVSVNDEELQTAYQALKDTYIAKELRHAAHILIEVSDQRDAAAALAKANSLAERIKAGESFADLARTESDDPVSAEQGGDLGTNEKGVFSPEFDDALYVLKDGEVSAPVQTEFGYHLIKLLGVERSDVPTYAEAEAGLRTDLLKQKAEERYVEQLEKLADLSFSAGDLREPAEALGLKIVKAGPFGRSGGEDDVISNAKVLAQAFDPELIKEGLNSTPVELDSGRSVVLRVTAHHDSREQQLDEVRGQLVALLTEQMARENLHAQADQLLSRLAEGDALEQVAAGAEISSKQGVTRNQQELPSELRSKLFSLPKPAADQSIYAKVELLDGSIAVVALDAVHQGDQELSDDELHVMGQMLSSRKGQEHYQALTFYLKQQAEIERK